VRPVRERAVQEVQPDRLQPAVRERGFDGQAAAGIPARAADRPGRRCRWHGPGAQDRRRRRRALEPGRRAGGRNRQRARIRGSGLRGAGSDLADHQ
nr:hypothetical protein [Tanacetum cinerariifolium]